jgi:ribulose-phosphate 3-epimerase
MKKSIRVVPAILTDDPKSLETMIQKVESFTDYAQIDIMDGKFVPSRSITWQDLTRVHPHLSWEVHLMVQQPEKHLRNYCQAGAQKAIFHFEATDKPRSVISLSKRLGVKVGIAINPDTPVSAILPVVDSVDSVLFLSVNPGFYGSKYIPGVLDKVKELRKAKPAIEIGIDGGMKENNVGQAAASGANVIFVGSAIILQPDPAASYHHLLALAENALK